MKNIVAVLKVPARKASVGLKYSAKYNAPKKGTVEIMDA